MPIRNFPFLGNIDSLKRPWLPIRIINPHTGLSVKVLGLIDTGADDCSIPAAFVSALGHNLNNGIPKQFKTDGGLTTGYSHTTKIEIYDLNDRLLYAINETPIDFMPQLNIPLLGVRQFLDRFELHVHYPKKTFSIKYPA